MTAIYQFGRFALSPATRQLLLNNAPALLGARAFDVLLALIERRDRLVTKNELLDLVWPGLVVEENNLQVQISALRKVLGPDAIATVVGRGYRFALAVDCAVPGESSLGLAQKHNLPLHLKAFVGRTRELAEVAHVLERSRIVTLVGAGGIGKTRLSVEVGAGMANAYSGGTWFVELAPLLDGRLVAQAVASVLGVTEEAGHPLEERLLAFVKTRQLLLILDNCEHLVQACADLVKPLLLAAPELKVLATSREPLRISGEVTYALPTLSVPNPHPALPVEALAQYDAVRLFSELAVAAQPAFRLNTQNAIAVNTICHQLDGIPLAIELAAARVRALSVEKVAACLSDDFHLLTGGDRTASPRQQTLKACIDWSYDLLSGPERALFRRLAVFAGGWTLQAVEAVASGGGVGRSDVPDLLAHLVEKSLVEVSAGEYRYRLLATIRQYALARLDESAEGESVRKRHFDFYLAATERATLHLRGPAARTWFAQIDLERDNIIAALAWCQAAEGRTESALRLVAATARYWSYGGMMELGYRLTVEALSSRSASMQSRARGAALEAAGNLGSYLGRYVEAHRYGEESLAIARAEGDEEGVIAALILSGWASHARGNLAEARIRGQEALDLSRKLGSQPSLNSALNGLAELYRAEGDLSAAERCYEEAMAVARELDYPSSIAAYLVNLAMVSIERGSGDRARRMLAEAGAIAERIGGKRMAWGVLDVSAGLAATIGQWIRAARFLGAAEAEREAMKLHRDPADEAFLTPLITRTREALGESQFAAAVAEGRALTFGDGMAEAREWLEHPT